MKRPSPTIRRRLTLHRFGPWYLNNFFLTKGMNYYIQVKLGCAQTGANTKTNSLFKHLLSKPDGNCNTEAALVALWLEEVLWLLQVANDLPITISLFFFVLLCACSIEGSSGVWEQVRTSVLVLGSSSSEVLPSVLGMGWQIGEASNPVVWIMPLRSCNRIFS